MGLFGPLFGDNTGTVVTAPPPTLSTASTAESIRDRVIALIEATVPSLLAGDKFRHYRNEGQGDFHQFAQTAPQNRRFQVRDDGNDSLPLVSNTVIEEREMTLNILIAYKQDARAGRNNALDRDDMTDSDWKKIDRAIGICGAGNFTGSYDCIPLGATKSVERDRSVDFMSITAKYRYWRSTT